MLITIMTIALTTPLTVWKCHGTGDSKMPLEECLALGGLEWTEEGHFDHPCPLP